VNPLRQLRRRLSRAAAAVPRCFRAGGAAVALALASCGGGYREMERIMSADVRSPEKHFDDYTREIVNYGLGYSLAQGLAVAAYWQLGRLGATGGRVWDDQLRGLILGVGVQLVVTAAALNNDLPYAFADGLLGGLAVTGIRAGIRVRAARRRAATPPWR
jgi:hypothetical protein